MTVPGSNDTDKVYRNTVVNLLGPDQPATLLFVDHRKVIQRSFSRVLANIDVTIDTAETVFEAMAAITQQQYSIVVASDEIDNEQGIEFLEQALKVSPKSIRILISSRSDLDTTVDAINKIGLFAYIVMPWDPNELRENIKRACERYAILLENDKLSVLLDEKALELRNLATKLENEVQDRTTNLLIGLNTALDLRDNETQSHSQRVALLAKRLAEQINLSQEETLFIERGSLLHDIGKIGVSDTILLKPSKLTDDEWVEMKKHAEHGYRILEDIHFLGNARLVVWQHHERWDGNGYPQKLKGEEIYIGARIFAIIDTYDAITSDRPYRKGRSHEVACAEIAQMSGTQFDAKLVEAWLQISKEEITRLKTAAKDTKASTSISPPLPKQV